MVIIWVDNYFSIDFEAYYVGILKWKSLNNMKDILINLGNNKIIKFS
jgi:hypothetical protein